MGICTMNVSTDVRSALLELLAYIIQKAFTIVHLLKLDTYSTCFYTNVRNDLCDLYKWTFHCYFHSYSNGTQ